MRPVPESAMTRRRFLASTTLTAGVVCFAPRDLFVARESLLEKTRMEAWDFTFPAAPTGAIPATVFQDEHEIHIKGMSVVLKHYGNAHTNSDVLVDFIDADITQTGDTFWNGSYPFIDYSTGGSIDGQIRAAEKNLARATAKTVVIPGHGPVGGKPDLTMFRDALVDVGDKVTALKKQGPCRRLSLPDPRPATTRNAVRDSLVPAYLSDWCIRASKDRDCTCTLARWKY